MRKHLVILCMIISLLLIILIMQQRSSMPTIAYFPIDEQTTFEHAHTTIQVPKNKRVVSWLVESTSSDTAYLRQDVSLLYENGKFKGVLSKWKEQTAHIQLTKNIQQNNNSLLEAISFHHAEIHYPNDLIKSVQQMTTTKLYDIHDEKLRISFHTPTSKKEKKWKSKLDSVTQRQLTEHWKNLMTTFSIDQANYLLIPLTELAQYDQNNLPNHTQKVTNQIIGQLWEGLYKNYIVPLAYNENHDTTHFIPLILLAKDNSHLLVVYELNGEKKKLIQQLP